MASRDAVLLFVRWMGYDLKRRQERAPPTDAMVNIVLCSIAFAVVGLFMAAMMAMIFGPWKIFLLLMPLGGVAGAMIGRVFIHNEIV